MKSSRIPTAKKIAFFRRALYKLLPVAVIAPVTTVLLAAGLGGRASSSITNAMPRARLSDYVSIQAAGRGNPWINLTDGHDVLTEYSKGSRTLDQEANPAALASGDFDGDGVPDLVSAYSTAGGGSLTIHRGNVDSIYPYTAEAAERKANGTFTDSPFLSPANVVELTASPDFIQAGDFNGDGFCDVVVASRGSRRIALATSGLT